MPEPEAVYVTRLSLRHISKQFGSTTVLNDINLEVDSSEFIAFLGPSGCGKTTLLRMIAGLETPDSGEIHIGERRIDTLPPGKRGVAMVFQHYALYPHMTIAGNMGFGLKNAGIDKTEIETRINEAARILEIEAHLEKKPGQLSGGQKQRVAIGRAIVKNPDIFLFDEPMSNLDAALRNRTRLELAQLRRRIHATMILVTHDQVEAMTLADRIVVLKDRTIQQVGAPMDIYSRPANRFVASFVGAPAMNFIEAELIGEHAHKDYPGAASIRLKGGQTLYTAVPVADLSGAGLTTGAHLHLGLRPEMVRVAPLEGAAVSALVQLVERLGERTLCYLRLEDGTAITAEDEGTSRVQIGDHVGLNVRQFSAHLFDAEGKGYHPAARGA
jgi:multiple sugar transport system ATP-binding protein